MVVETLDSSCDGLKRKHANGGEETHLDELSNGDTGVSSSKRARVSRGEMAFQDIYGADALLNEEDEEDDSDWEPVLQNTPVEFVKWCCVNCTMANPGDMVHCYICGEHKESGILRHGYLASPFFKDTGLTEVEEKCGGSSSATSSTAVGFDERMLLHSEFEVKAQPHPERPDRLRAIAASLATAGVFPGRCLPIHAREITKQELQMVHTSEHVDAVNITSQLLYSYFTTDTYANEYSARAARLAAGLCADLATEIYSGRVKNGFALVRPPGHHAGIKHAMGFCLHNNAAVAALVAQAAGARKVLIVDWDVHHGNGTQEIFEQNKSVLYISLHRHEGGNFYPGTGAADEVGTNGAEGYCVNVPWSCGGVGDKDYIYAFQHVVLPIASQFSPDFVIVSAGFDAARGDPLGCCDVTPAGYSRMTQMLGDICGGKMLVILEGGYNLRSISSSATAVIKVLLGENPENDDLPIATTPSKAGLETVLDVMNIQMKFWPSLATAYSNLLSEWETRLIENKKNQVKRKLVRVPTWWKWGRKKFMYRFLSARI